MIVHHFNCGTFDPVLGLLAYEEGQKMVTHVTAIDTGKGIVLIDSGVGLEDCANPRARVSSVLRKLGRISLDPAETAALQLEALGYSRDDVTDIVLTHMDADHTGGLPDFPKAIIHVHEDEFFGFTSRSTAHEQKRYQPIHLEGSRHVETYGAGTLDWFGFEGAQRVRGLDLEMMLVPLNGHTRGHLLVAYNVNGKWQVHAGDTYYHRGQVKPVDTPLSFKLFYNLTAFSRPLRQRSETQLRAFIANNPDVTVYCTHDPFEFAELAGH